MSAHKKAPTTAKQTGAFKTNLSLNFNLASHAYNAIISIAKGVAYDMLPVVAIYCAFISGVLPAVGLAALFGPSASGKSFLAMDMAAAIAEGADGAANPFKLHIEALGSDDYGDPVTSCVVLRDTNAQDIQRVKVPQGDNQRLVYEGIRPLFKDGAIGKAGAPPLRPCIDLEVAVAAGAGRLTCPSDKRTSRARTAIAGMVSRGLLGLNEGFLWTV